MKYLKTVGLLIVLMSLAITGSASATELTNATEMLPSGATITAESEGPVTFQGVAAVECKGSSISGKTSNTGGATETVKENIETLTFTGCSSTVSVLSKGTLEFHTAGASPNGNGTLTSSSAELTILAGGIGCIYKTSSTDVGLVTGSATTGKTAALDIEASLSKSGGSFLCPSTAKMTGIYKVTAPDTLNVDTGSSGPSPTTLTTSLSGESKSGEELTVFEGAGVKDQAALSGANAGKASGTVSYSVYSDSKCEKLVTKAGEFTFSEGKVPASEERKLAAAAVYYWQASYSGDALNTSAKAICGKEVLTVKAATTLSTSLLGEGGKKHEAIEGEKLSVETGARAADTSTLGGTSASTATGQVTYKVYSDSKCETLVTKAGEVSLKEGAIPQSEEVELKEGIYYWQAEYGGDSLHQGSVSSCGKAVLTVQAATTLSTSLAGEGNEGEAIEVSEEASVIETATLSGAKAKEATGTVHYFVYSDQACTELVAEAGEATVSGEVVPSSLGKTLKPGLYFWQAIYSGDELNHGSRSACGSEVELVVPPITTTLTSGASSGQEVQALQGVSIHQRATLHGEHAAEATGTVEYSVYSDEKCEKLLTKAGEVKVEGVTAPASEAVEPKAIGTYYWQAHYSGDETNPVATSACGSTVSVVTAPTSVTAKLSAGAEEGTEIKVSEGTVVTGHAALSGTEAAGAEGTATYMVYSDSSCTEAAEIAGLSSVEKGAPGASEGVTLPAGTYYWKVEYSGDGVNHPSTSACGAGKEVVTTPITTTLSGGGQSGNRLQLTEGASVTDKATLYGEHAAEATGTVEYSVYSDEKCEKLLTKAGEVKVEGPSVPSSSAVEFKEEGGYFWRAHYSGDANNPAATSACGAGEVQVRKAWQYAALGDSFSSGEGLRASGAAFYGKTDIRRNLCHRSSQAWPALVAENAFGGIGVSGVPTVYEKSPLFIFRACSGAKTVHVWGGGENGGQYDEVVEPKEQWVKPTPSQLSWLTDAKGKPNGAIERVTLTIGGNDAGFAPVVRACWTTSKRVFQYSPASCQKVIAKEEANGIKAIKANLPVILEKIVERAPSAEIGVLLYPRALNLNVGEIPVGTVGGVNLAVVHNVPQVKGEKTAAQSLTDFLINLNKTIVATVKGSKVANKVQVINTEAAFEGPFGVHRLGDPEPWLNGIIFPNTEESFHPTVCGHKAMARLSQNFVAAGKPPIIVC